MGNGNISRVLIHVNPTKRCYLSGDIISGTVSLNLIESKREIDRISIEFIGEIGYTTTEKYSYIRGTTPLTRHHHKKFYCQKLNLTQSNIEREISFWPFQFQICDHLPPTINKRQNYPHIKYYLQVKMFKEGFKTKSNVIKHLSRIYPRVNLFEHHQCLKSIEFTKQNEKDLRLHVYLNKSGFVPGEFIQITLQIQNPRRLFLQFIHFSMLRQLKVEEYQCEDVIFEMKLPKILDFKEEQIQEMFSMKIPSILLPPSYLSHQDFLQNLSIKISYKFKLKAFLTIFILIFHFY